MYSCYSPWTQTSTRIYLLGLVLYSGYPLVPGYNYYIYPCVFITLFANMYAYGSVYSRPQKNCDTNTEEGEVCTLFIAKLCTWKACVRAECLQQVLQERNRTRVYPKPLLQWFVRCLWNRMPSVVSYIGLV